VRELSLIAQDLTSYGSDRDDGAGLTRLLEALLAVDGIAWVPAAVHVSAARHRRAAASGRARGTDLPVPRHAAAQHGSDRMLRAMRRGSAGAGQRLRDLVARIRERVPGVVLRSSFIVGFPGETEDDFEELPALPHRLPLRARRGVSATRTRRARRPTTSARTCRRR